VHTHYIEEKTNLGLSCKQWQWNTHSDETRVNIVDFKRIIKNTISKRSVIVARLQVLALKASKLFDQIAHENSIIDQWALVIVDQHISDQAPMTLSQRTTIVFSN
jgi:hypothetical protein